MILRSSLLTPSVRTGAWRRVPVSSSLQRRLLASQQSSSSQTGTGASTPSSVPPSSPSSSSSSSSSSPSGSASKSSKYEKQRRTEWIVIGVSGAVASLGAWFLYTRPSSSRPHPELAKLVADAKTPFTITTRSPTTGQRMQRVLKTLTDAEVNEKLKANELSVDLSSKKAHCLVARYDLNSVAANDPIEDRSAQIIVERDCGSRGRVNAERLDPKQHPQEAGAASAVGDLAFFAIMDGHAGFHTSSYLSQKLIAFVALELEKVFRETGEYAALAKAQASMPGKIWRAVAGGEPSDAAASQGIHWQPEVVKRAISKAFVGLDKEICNTPVELLKEYELAKASTSLGPDSNPADPSAPSQRSLSGLAHSVFPTPGSGTKGGDVSMTATQKSAYETMLPALSGSCALLTYIDSATKDVFVACTGDSRAIGGWQDTRTGKWTIEPLSEDQTGRNPSEVARMRKEHPVSEADQVIMRGRVLGGLEPTRAFGDARYKWSRDVQERLHSSFLPGGRDEHARGPPRLLQTPPYVTARPVIEWRRLASVVLREGAVEPAQNSGSTVIAQGPDPRLSRTPASTKQLRFIVMATDGLWDMLSNEEVGTLVAGHLEKIQGTAKASELERRLLAPSPASFASSLSNAVSTAIGSGGANEKPQGEGQSGAASAPSTAAGPNANSAHHPLGKRGPNDESEFVFEDTNLATHLVRNAFGGANRVTARALLAIPAPDARRYRDDITVNVILLNEQEAQQQPSQQANAGGAAAKQKIAASEKVEEIKSKL
ncbi:unnamed protein product [Parajaminaea phylloscopi]